MKKRILCMILMAFLIVLIMPLRAMAGGDTDAWSMLALAMKGVSTEAFSDVTAFSVTDGTDKRTINLLEDITGTASSKALEVPSGTNIELNLNNHTLNRNAGETPVDDGYVIKIDDADLTIIGGGTIKGGNNTGNGGCIINNGGKLNVSNCNISDNKTLTDGGAIYNKDGTVELNVVIISENTAKGNGGAIYTAGNGTYPSGLVKLIGSTGTGVGSIESCSAEYGGAVYANMAQFELTNAEIINCKASRDGGGVVISNGGTFNMNDGKINGNEAGTCGGGVRICEDGIFSMTGKSIISGNSGSQGAGVYFIGESISLSGDSLITQNVAAAYGGGVGAFGDGKFTMSENSKIAYNSAKAGGGVYLNNTISFYMSGGSIDHNTAQLVGGGFAAVNSSISCIILGGTSQITDNVIGGTITGNVLSGGTPSNAWTQKTCLTLGTKTGESDAAIGNGIAVPAEGFSVGVTTYTAPTEGNPVKITTNGTSADLKYFTSDEDFILAVDTDHFELYKAIASNCSTDKDYKSLAEAISEAQDGDEIELYSENNSENVTLPEGVTLYAKNGYTGTVSTDVQGKAVCKQDMFGTFSYKFFVTTAYNIVYKDMGDKAFSGIHEEGYPAYFICEVPTPLMKASKEDYAFLGWYDNAACEGEPMTGFAAYEYSDEITLYAKWNKVIFAVSFDGGNGAKGSVDPRKGKISEKITLPDNAFTKPGYTFEGWTDGTTVYGEGDEFTIAGDVTLKAKWKQDTYYVSFSGGKDVTGNAPLTIKAHYNEKIALPKNTFTKKGYKFAGWTDGTNVYKEGVNYTVKKTVTLTAKWDKLPQYTISFTGGSGATGTAPKSIKGYEKDSIKLPKNTFTKSGYEFTGWSDGKKTYKEGAKYAIPAKNVKFTAVWKQTDPTLTFIERCYKVALGRDADPEGLKYWQDKLTNYKYCGAQVGYGFIFSDEYKATNASDEQFIKDLYKMFFDREPDQAGYDYWMGQMKNKTSREEVFAGFANSDEFFDLCSASNVARGIYITGYDIEKQGGVNGFVARLYKVCLDRLPEKEGHAYWVNKLISGEKTGTDVSREFILSDEFMGLNLSDEVFVDKLYIAFFGREGDSDGIKYWLGELKNNKPREEVFNGFAVSDEFKNLCKSFGIQP